MEILKFSEPPKRSNRSGAARKNGLMPMVTFGIAVLVLGGMGTTLAGTITLNGTNNSVEFGQGVVTTAACDTSISVIPSSGYDTSTGQTYSGFYVSEIKVAGIGIAASDTTTAAGLASGCLGKTFTLRGYNSQGIEVKFAPGSAGNGTPVEELAFSLPSETSTAFNNSGITGLTSGVTFTMGGNFNSLTGTEVDDNFANTGLVTITGFRAASTLARVTLETS